MDADLMMNAITTLPGTHHGEWREKNNGNFILFDEDLVGTVFQRADGDWGGVANERFLRGSYETPAEAASVLLRGLDGEDVFRPPEPVGWRKAKGHSGWWRRVDGNIISVKQAKSGSWFVSINGTLMTDPATKRPIWFDTAEDAKDYYTNWRYP